MKPTAIAESILFTAGEPVSLSELGSLLEVGKEELRKILQDLSEELTDRGVRLVQDGRMAQLVSAPDAGPYLARYIQSELRGKLSSSAMETLAVIAYKGPVTRPEIEAIRGVQSAQAIRTLTIRGLIAEVGRKKEPGRPILYEATLELLKHLGVSGRDELPELPEELVAKLNALPNKSD